MIKVIDKSTKLNVTSKLWINHLNFNFSLAH